MRCVIAMLANQIDPGAHRWRNETSVGQVRNIRGKGSSLRGAFIYGNMHENLAAHQFGCCERPCREGPPGLIECRINVSRKTFDCLPVEPYWD